MDPSGGLVSTAPTSSEGQRSLEAHLGVVQGKTRHKRSHMAAGPPRAVGDFAGPVEMAIRIDPPRLSRTAVLDLVTTAAHCTRAEGSFRLDR